MNLRTLMKTVVTSLPANMRYFVKNRYYYTRLQEGILEQEFDVVKHLVKPGQQVADVGANVGVYTVYLAGLVGEAGHVHAIEPIPETFGVLQYVVRKQKWPHITLYNCAISDTAGSVRMVVPNSEDGTPNYYMAHLTSAAAQEDKSQLVVEVQALSLDLLLVEPIISFIKCDVEGHELACIRGAQAIIRRSRPAWFIEVSGDPDQTGSNAQRVLDTMSAAGYGCYWYDGSALRSRQAGTHAVNYFILTEQHGAALALSFPGPIVR